MPMTDPRRDFIDHYTLEAAYPHLRAKAAHRQIGQRQFDEAALLRFRAIHGEEWQAWEHLNATLDFRSDPSCPIERPFVFGLTNSSCENVCTRSRG